MQPQCMPVSSRLTGHIRLVYSCLQQQHRHTNQAGRQYIGCNEHSCSADSTSNHNKQKYEQVTHWVQLLTGQVEVFTNNTISTISTKHTISTRSTPCTVIAYSHTETCMEHPMLNHCRCYTHAHICMKARVALKRRLNKCQRSNTHAACACSITKDSSSTTCLTVIRHPL